MQAKNTRNRRFQGEKCSREKSFFDGFNNTYARLGILYVNSDNNGTMGLNCCQIAMCLGGHAPGARSPGDQARCQLLYTAENIQNLLLLFLWVGSIVLLDCSWAERIPTVTGQISRL